MAREQVTARRQLPYEALDELVPRGLFKIDHHVSAEYDVELTYVSERLEQIERCERNQRPNGRDHAVETP